MAESVSATDVDLVVRLRAAVGISLREACDAVAGWREGSFEDPLVGAFHVEARKELVRVGDGRRPERDMRRARELSEAAAQRDPSLRELMDATPSHARRP